jgi:hypothetical protein
MKYIKKNISSTNNILSIPFGTSAYTVIVDENDSKHLYLGVSPIKIFSGISDISGHYSFGYTSLADVVDGYIINRKYSDLRKVMFEHNINYIMHTVNVPNELIHSYAFNTDLYTAQDERFRREISGKKFAQSTNGNYVLYEAKKLNSILKSENIYIVAGKRTAFGSFGGGLKEVSATDLSVAAGNATLIQAGVKPDHHGRFDYRLETGSTESIYNVRSTILWNPHF